MRAARSTSEIPLPAQPSRIRRQRLLCLGFLPLLALPLLLVGGGPFAPVDAAAPVAVRSVPGQPSYAPSTEAPPTTARSRAALRQPATTSIPASVTTSTVVVPVAKSVAPAPTTAPARTAATAPSAPTAAPIERPAAGAIAAAAPAPATTAPRPPVTTSTTTSTTTTTTAPPPPPPPPSPNRQSGQATWYRWKRGNCAHNSLPMGTKVTVTAVASGRTTTCVVGDRGGFRNPTIIDLDASVFEQIAPLGAGRIAVVISW